jgi:hypothetical protein
MFLMLDSSSLVNASLVNMLCYCLVFISKFDIFSSLSTCLNRMLCFLFFISSFANGLLFALLFK